MPTGRSVFWEFREVTDGVAGQWARLAARLDGAGVPSLEDALRELQLEPVHVPFRAIFADGLTVAVIDGVATTAQLDELERRFAAFLRAIADGDRGARGPGRRSRPSSATVPSGRSSGWPCRRRTPTSLPSPRRSRPGSRSIPPTSSWHRKAVMGLDRHDRAALLAWLALSHAGALAPGASVAATSLAWYDELRLPAALVAGLHDTGFGEGEAWAVTDQVRVLLALPRPSAMRGSSGRRDARLLDAWLALEMTRVAIGVNTWEGVEYIDRDRSPRPAGMGRPPRHDRSVSRRGRASRAPGSRPGSPTAAEEPGYRVDRLRAALASAPGAGRDARAEGHAAPRVPRAAPRSSTAARLPEQDPPQE